MCKDIQLYDVIIYNGMLLHKPAVVRFSVILFSTNMVLRPLVRVETWLTTRILYCGVSLYLQCWPSCIVLFCCMSAQEGGQGGVCQ